MGIQLTKQQQTFVNVLIRGGTQVEAYKEAGYSCSNLDALDKKAQQVASRRGVREALALARGETIAAVDMKLDDIIAMLLRSYNLALALETPQVNASVSAAMGIAKLLGMVVDRAQIQHLHSKPSPVPSAAVELDEAEWRRLFATPK